MRQRVARVGLTVLLAGLLAAVQVAGASWRNGKRFDPGVAMTERAAGAPKQLDQVAGYLGQWDVDVLTFRGDGKTVSKGQAEIAFVNRGHALMESYYSVDHEGGAYASVYFLGYNPASSRWFLGGADNRTERAWVADGGFEDSAATESKPTNRRLVLTDTQRRSGGVVRTEIRHSFEHADPDVLSLVIEESTDGGDTWSAVEERTYRRRVPSSEFLEPAGTYGLPRPDRPAGAAAFDFLIGEWNESHQMTFANGQRAEWPASGTAVFALDGSAVLEYSWFDVDPSLPDAATTILRLYNRAMRRWECLFVPNRGHSILYFGGRQEGDEIVLGNFETHSATPPIARYVFHSISADSYSWYSDQSLDREATWTRQWIIESERTAGPQVSAPAGSEER